VVPERREQALHAAAVALLDDVVQRFAPLTLLDRFNVGVIALGRISLRGSTFVESGRITILLLYGKSET
jgi:hypothetical protein